MTNSSIFNINSKSQNQFNKTCNTTPFRKTRKQFPSYPQQFVNSDFIKMPRDCLDFPALNYVS